MGTEQEDNDDEETGGEKVTVDLRCSHGNSYPVKTSLESTVGSFRAVVAREYGLPYFQERLIYKGRVLKDDYSLQSYGLQANHEVDLVDSVHSFTCSLASLDNATGTSETRSKAGYTREELHEALAKLMSSSEVLERVFFRHLRKRSRTKTISRLKSKLYDQTFVRALLQVARYPKQKFKIPTKDNSCLKEIQSRPKLRYLLTSRYYRFLDRIRNAARGSINKPSAIATEAPASSGGPNTDPLPDTWLHTDDATDDDMWLEEKLRNILAAHPDENRSSSQQSKEDVRPEDLFATQLAQLEEIGFADREENIKALVATSGDVNAAVMWLLSNTYQ